MFVVFVVQFVLDEFCDSLLDRAGRFASKCLYLSHAWLLFFNFPISVCLMMDTATISIC